MARIDHWQFAIALGFALCLLAGCEQKGAAEKAGEKVDKAVDQTGKALKDAEKKVKDATK